MPRPDEDFRRDPVPEAIRMNLDSLGLGSRDPLLRQACPPPTHKWNGRECPHKVR